MGKRDERDKEKVKLICQDCGVEYELSYGRYRRLKDDNGRRCKACTNIKRSKMFENYTEEQMDALRKQRSMTSKKVWASLSKEQYAYRCSIQKNKWEGLSPEEIEERMKSCREASKKYHRSDKAKEKLRQRNIEKWNSLSDTDRQIELNRLSKIRDDCWNSMTMEEKFEKMKKMWDKIYKIGPTEYVFKDKIESIGLRNGIDYIWGYSTYPFIDENFFKKFPLINPISKEMNFPYHTWDFKLNLRDKSILVDIDGSAHSEKSMHFSYSGKEYTEREIIDYRDSQRIFKIPDNLTAYIIKAYNDKIEDDTIVQNVKTNDCIKFKDFLNTLIIDKMPEKEVRELMKLCKII